MNTENSASINEGGGVLPSINFYHLTTTSLEHALPKLLERALAGGYKVLVVTSSEAYAEHLDKLLWSYEEGSFLPHGRHTDKNPELQPVLISTTLENLNQANILMTTDGRYIEEKGQFSRIIDIFDGKEKEALESARNRWKKYKDSGFEMTYYKQNEQGVWHKAA